MANLLRFIRNKRFLTQSCINFIHHWEGYTSDDPCEDVLMNHIIRYIDTNKDLIAAQDDRDPDWRVFIFKTIAKVSYDMVASNVSYGRKNKNLRYVHTKAMEELLQPGYISQREFDDDAESLNQIVKERQATMMKNLGYHYGKN